MTDNATIDLAILKAMEARPREIGRGSIRLLLRREHSLWLSTTEVHRRLKALWSQHKVYPIPGSRHALWALAQ